VTGEALTQLVAIGAGRDGSQRFFGVCGGSSSATSPTQVKVASPLSDSDRPHRGNIGSWAFDTLDVDRAYPPEMRVCVLIALLVGASCGDNEKSPPTTPFLVTPHRVVANGTQRLLAVVRLRDDAGRPLANQRVTVTTDGNDTIDHPTGMTNDRGELIAAITSTDVGERTVTATAMGRTYSDTMTFTPPCELPLLPNQPDLALVGILAGDFNSDGLPDLVATGADGVNFASGNGDGSFQPIENVSGEKSSTALIKGDFNGDGVLDIAGTVYSQSGPAPVFVLRGIGDGTFEPAIKTDTSVFSVSYASGDFDGDGVLDLVALEAANGVSTGAARIAMYFGTGDGSFLPAQLLRTSVPTPDVGVVVAPDLDGDGSADIAFANPYAHQLVLYHSNGDRTFTQWPDLPFGADSVGAMEVTDFNRDGREDLALALLHNTSSGTSGGMVAFESTGNGQFDEIGRHDLGLFGASLVIGDYNNDALLDVVSSDPLNLFVALGNAQGTLDPAVTVPVPFGALRLQTADFNGDGNLDLALEYNKTAIVAGTGVGTFDLEPNAIDPVKSIAVGDLDKDGKPDLATVPLADSNGVDPAELWVRRGNGDGTFASAVVYATSERPQKVFAADVNGDTWVDLVTLNDFNLNVFLNQQNGELSSALSTLATSPTDRRQGMALADFNADGKLDIAATRLLASSFTAKLDIALGNGDGTFGAVMELAADASDVSTGDLNNDGVVDIMTDSLALYLGNGDGTFGDPRQIDLGMMAYSIGFVLTDVTGDGNLDVIVQTWGLSILEGHGDGTFELPQVIGPSGLNPELVVDLNNDGQLDIIARSDGVGPYLLLGRADGTFREPVLYRSGVGYYGQSFAVDFDGGMLDLAMSGGILLQRACSP
jgi:hypothetical protein